MLKGIVFKNLVHFEDKISIDFVKSPTKRARSRKKGDFNRKNSDLHQAEKAGVNLNPPENGLNLFVGANFCGKSTVIELIRRCMTEEINLSQTRSFSLESNAYAFCEFELDSYQVLTGFIKETENSKICQIYKIFLYRHINKTDIFLRWKKPGCRVITQSDPIFQAEPQEDLLSLLKEAEKSIESIIEKIKVSEKSTLLYHKMLNLLNRNTPEEPNWKKIEEKYAATFPLRGIGIVQWSRSRKIKDKSNYRKACERAEVLKELLFCKSSTENDKGKQYFDYITYPEQFEFVKDGKEIVVKHNNCSSFPLLKTSEGIIEAKITSLLLGQNDIQTLCLEDPDRGMHPQMIERLKTVLYCEGLTKTIIVVTHSPYFVDTITINKTHVFFRTKGEQGRYCCKVRQVTKCKDISCVASIETLRTLLFATKVLLVEGPTDREVIQAIFTHIQKNTWKDEIARNANVFETLQACSQVDYTTYQIIPINSCNNAKKYRSFCKFINMPCLCLLDLDKYVGVKDGKLEIGPEVPNNFRKKITQNYTEYKKLFVNNEFEEFSDYLKSNKKTFIWNGELEDAILSDPILESTITKSLNLDFTQNKSKTRILKDKLLEELSSQERTEFASCVIVVPEIKKFIDFLEEEELEMKGRFMHSPSSENLPISSFCFTQIFEVIWSVCHQILISVIKIFFMCIFLWLLLLIA